MNDRSLLLLECISSRFISYYSLEYWGFSISIMEKTGKAFCRLYQFNDYSDTVYLDSLGVDVKIRGQGMGTELQLIRENMGVKLGATMSCLWVRKNTWMHDWYKRRGYEDWKDNENEENAIWMKKMLIKDNVL